MDVFTGGKKCLVNFNKQTLQLKSFVCHGITRSSSLGKIEEDAVAFNNSAARD
jgi:hypothetical protein